MSVPEFQPITPLRSVRCAGIILFILTARKRRHTDISVPCPRSPSCWKWMRQKGNPGLLSVGRTRLGYRRRHSQTASDSPAGFCLRTPRGAGPSEFGWVPAASEPRVNQLFLSIASSLLSPQASERDASPEILSETRQRGPRKGWSGGGGSRRDPGSHLQGGGAGARLTISPSRPAEGAAARASGPKAPGPWTGRLDLQTRKLGTPRVGGIFLFVYLFWWLAPLWPLTSVSSGLLSRPLFPIPLAPVTPPLAFEVSLVPTLLG